MSKLTNKFKIQDLPQEFKIIPSKKHNFILIGRHRNAKAQFYTNRQTQKCKNLILCHRLAVLPEIFSYWGKIVGRSEQNISSQSSVKKLLYVRCFVLNLQLGFKLSYRQENLEYKFTIYWVLVCNNIAWDKGLKNNQVNQVMNTHKYCIKGLGTFAPPLGYIKNTKY